MTTLPFTNVFGRALRGHACDVVGLHDEAVALPVARWTAAADSDDLSILDLCRGPTLDIGCGPGRMTAELATRGHVVLGIDVVPEAVGETVRRGGPALRRDVFGEVPGEGRWHSALLADGNIGIGGDPVALLQRVRSLLDPRGRCVVELDAPGVRSRTVRANLRCGDDVSRDFPWAVVGIDDIDEIAVAAGFTLTETGRHGERWCGVLEEAR